MHPNRMLAVIKGHPRFVRWEPPQTRTARGGASTLASAQPRAGPLRLPTTMSSVAFNALIVALMAYFVVLNLTVERAYCNAPLERSSTMLLIAETVAFCEKANPLFLLRPEWLRLATCFSAYGMCPFYLLIGMTAVLDAWVRTRGLILLFLGGKIYAIAFYHAMEFTSASPPLNLAMYWGAEGPYLVSIGLLLWKLCLQGPASKTKRS